MSQMPCQFAGDRDETLIAYLYDDIDPAARAAFDTHLAGCDQCRAELEQFGAVRATLARWNPPEPKRALDFDSQPAAPSRAGRRASAWTTLSEIPAWAQVAAALLFLGVSAGIANLDVRYDGNGLAIRTGWSRPAAAPQPVPTAVGQIGAASQSGVAQGFSPISRADLAAFERQLRTEFRAAQTAVSAPAPRSAAGDAEILRKVRALIEETERRQQRELALRLAQAITDMNTQRQADLRRVDLSLNRVENNLGVEVLKNRQSMQQYFLRVNQRQ